MSPLGRCVCCRMSRRCHRAESAPQPARSVLLPPPTRHLPTATCDPHPIHARPLPCSSSGSGSSMAAYANLGMPLDYGQGSAILKTEPSAVLPQLGAHPHLQASDWHSTDRQRERQEREARRKVLREARSPLMQLPVDHMFEIPGR